MLKQKLQAEQIIALKSGEKEKLSTIRFVIAQIKNKEIDKNAELNEEEEIAVVKKFVKELQETIEAAKKNNRSDLVTENERQIEIIKAYIPAEISDEELKKEIERIISENKDLYQKNAKAIIGICMKQLKTKADSSRVIKILNSL
jgi:hypothetical protein